MIGSPAYVTIRTSCRTCLYGEVIQGTMQLNEIGRIVDDAWRASAVLRPRFELDAWVVMLQNPLVFDSECSSFLHDFRAPLFLAPPLLQGGGGRGEGSPKPNHRAETRGSIGTQIE